MVHLYHWGVQEYPEVRSVSEVCKYFHPKFFETSDNKIKAFQREWVFHWSTMIIPSTKKAPIRQSPIDQYGDQPFATQFPSIFDLFVRAMRGSLIPTPLWYLHHIRKSNYWKVVGQDLHADIVSQLFSSQICDPSLSGYHRYRRAIFISWSCHGGHIKSDNATYVTCSCDRP